MPDPRSVKLLPDAPLDDATEFAFIDGRPFVNARKHQEVVDRHVAEVERLRLQVTALENAGMETAARLGEAETEVERLREERALLEPERDTWKTRSDFLEADNEQLREASRLITDSLARVVDQRDARNAEVERLREALDWIYAEPEDPAKVQLWAKAALDGKPHVR